MASWRMDFLSNSLIRVLSLSSLHCKSPYLSTNGNLKTAMLGHLSKESNFPELAYQTVIDEIISSNNNNINLSVASRDCPSKLITL